MIRFHLPTLRRQLSRLVASAWQKSFGLPSSSQLAHIPIVSSRYSPTSDKKTLSADQQQQEQEQEQEQQQQQQQLSSLMEQQVVRCAPPHDETHDFQCNAPLALRQIHARKSPREAGQMLAASLIGNGDDQDRLPHEMAAPSASASFSSSAHRVVQDADVAGPGFVNMSLTSQALTKWVHQLATAESLQLCADSVMIPNHQVAEEPADGTNQRLRAVVDFSSPNIAKEMHVGHLRSTLLGDSLCRMLEFVGFQVERVNHVGDWGTQFGMLLTFLQDLREEKEAQGHEGDVVSSASAAQLQSWYRDAKTRFDRDPTFADRSRASVVRLQQGDAEALQMWEQLCKISRKEFDAVYKRLGIVDLEERGESFYQDRLAGVVDHMLSAGVAQIDERGSVIIFPQGEVNTEEENSEPPLIIRKSDGGYTYGTTDLAALLHRVSPQEINANLALYIVDEGQRLHFESVFGAGRAAGWVPEDAIVEHVPFGVVTGEDGKKFRTRAGDVVRLADLLDEAHQRAKVTLVERKTELDAEELEENAKVLGIAAIKYADLRLNRTSNYAFSFDRMLDPRGDTAVYLLYTLTRLNSIRSRASEMFPADNLVLTWCQQGGIPSEQAVAAEDVDYSHPSERALCLQLAQFYDSIEDSLRLWQPSRIASFAHQLAVSFSSFYRDCPVLSPENSPETARSRILLCIASERVLRESLRLLGIPTLDRM